MENPHIATWFFSTKLEILIDHLIPVLGIKHYWYRVESQGRGSDHCHGCLWFADAPDLCTLSNDVKLGFIASKKLDTIYGEHEEKELYNSNSKIWFQDKKPLIAHLYSVTEIEETIKSMEHEKFYFINALEISIKQQQNAKYKNDMRYFFSPSLSIFHLLQFVSFFFFYS